VMSPKRWLCALGVAASALAQAQVAVPPAKQALVDKLLKLQQPGIEMAARNIVERPAAQMMQEAGRVLQAQVAADKREAVGKGIEADVKKYVEDAYPPVRDRAVALAPSTLGAAMADKFTEDELKQLVAWFESPVNKKFQQVSGEMQNSYMQKLLPEVRPLIEPKLRTLEQQVRTALGAPAAAGPGTSAPKAAAGKPPAKAASN
jgi:hypothetical protein